MAALAAASLGLAQRMAAEVGKGTLRQAITRSSGGYIAVYAVGSKALLVVVADVGLDMARLDREAMATVDRLQEMIPGRARADGQVAAGLSASGG
jgi:predicted regulator of Ras-like GTPase activity (Roadblock/LC7/MglB family)